MDKECLEEVAVYLHDELALTVPLDLCSLSARLGVAAVQELEIPELGRVSYVAGRPTITLRRSLPPERKRFTWAHEIGHILIDGAPNAARSSSTRVDSQDVERACDQLAAALLMPLPWARAVFSRRPLSIGVLEAARKSAKVSWSAAFLRSQDVAPSERGLLTFRRGWYIQCVGLGRRFRRPNDFTMVQMDATQFVELRVGATRTVFQAELKGDEERGFALLTPLADGVDLAALRRQLSDARRRNSA